jgi:two-component system chemotaxis response regulator CheB
VQLRGVVVIGGSAGGVEALVELVGGLPADLPAVVLVTIHIGEYAHSALPQILSRCGFLEAVHPVDGEPLRAARIYVAPPGRHLLMPLGKVELSAGPRINRHRPAVDAMFGSAARWAGQGVVAVVLSGLLDDGAVGAALIAQAGGAVVVQDPREALFPSMPQAALRAAPGAVAVSSAQLGEYVSELVGKSGETVWSPSDMRQAGSAMTMANSGDPRFLFPDEARLTRMVCPECGGVLAELELPQISYYRCHAGHHYGPQSLAAAQAESAESKLWAAVAALEEQAAFARHLAEHATAAQDHDTAVDHQRAADKATNLAKMMRAQLQQDSDPTADSG